MTASRLVPGPRRVAAAVMLAIAVVALTACDPKQAGSAAVVGGVRITETSVNADAESVLAAFQAAGVAPPSTQTLLRTLVERAVDNEIVEAAAKQAGILVTQGEIDKLISDNGGRVALTASFATRDGLWLPPGQIDELARTSLIQLALGNRLVPGGAAASVDAAVSVYKARLAAKLGVSVSPRYGKWSRVTLQITGDLNDLSRPAPAAAASVSPTG